jgi:hypothetical protein
MNVLVLVFFFQMHLELRITQQMEPLTIQHAYIFIRAPKY